MNRQRRKLGVYGKYGTLVAAAWLASACTSTLPPWTGGGTTAQPYATGGVPAGYYRVNPGDTLGRIAAAYGQRPQDIAAWNQLPPNAPVVAGQVLRVAPPSGAAMPSSPAVATPVPSPQITTPAPQAPAAAGVAQPAPIPQISLSWPVRGPIVERFVPGQSTGIVIGGTVGETVTAAAAGRVVYAGSGIQQYGPLVIIKHNDAIVTAYGHNSKLLVQEGDAVSQGQPIAQVGVDSRGVPGVQFEVRADGKPVDPLALLPR